MLPADVELYTSLVRSVAVLNSVAQRFLPRLERAERIRADQAARTVREMVTIQADFLGALV